MFIFFELRIFFVFNLFRVHPGLSWFHHGGGKFLAYVNLQLSHDGVNIV